MLTFRSILRASIAIAALLTLAPTASAELRWDQSFGRDGHVIAKHFLNDSFGISSVVALRDGGVAVAGVSRYNDDETWQVRVLTAHGVPDTRFGAGGLVRLPRSVSVRLISDWDIKLRVQRDGKLLIIGAANVGTRRDRIRCRCDGVRQGWGVVRLRRDGKLDRGYGSGGIALLRGVDGVVSDWNATSTAPPVAATALDVDGGLLVYGTSFEPVVQKVRFSNDTRPGIVVRVDREGEQDRSFGAGGRVYEHGFREQWADSMNVRRDGTIVTTRLHLIGSDHLGSAAAVHIRRYDRHGMKLTGRGRNDSYTRARIWSGSRVYASVSTHVDTKGRVLVDTEYGGNTYNENQELRRLGADGKPDRAFSGDGRVAIHPFVAPIGNLVFTDLVVSEDGARIRLIVLLWDRKSNRSFDLPSLMRVNERGSVVPVEGHALTPLPNIPGKDYISEGGAFDRAGRFVMLGSMHPFDDDLSGNYQNLIARLLDA